MTAVRVKFFHNELSDYQGGSGTTVELERTFQFTDSINIGDVYYLVVEKLRQNNYVDTSHRSNSDIPRGDGFPQEYTFTGRGIISITI